MKANSRCRETSSTAWLRDSVPRCVSPKVLATVDALTTAYQNSSGLKPHICITLQVWRPEVQNGSHGAKVKALAGPVPSGGSEGEPISSRLFQHLEAIHTHWPLAPSSVFPTSRAMSSDVCFCAHIFPGPPASLSSRIRTLVTTSENPRCLPISRSLITSAESFCHIHRFWRLGPGNPWGHHPADLTRAPAFQCAQC